MTTVFLYDYNAYAKDPVSRFAADDRSWTVQSVTIPKMNKAYRIALEISTDVPETYMAVDNFVFTSGSCKSVAVTTKAPILVPKQSLSCDFENGKSLCQWATPDPDNNWQVTSDSEQPNEGVVYQRPPTDHTFKTKQGQFALVEHYLIAGGSHTAIMNATDQGIGPLCLSLWYYMRTEGFAKLNVTVLGKAASTRQGFPPYYPLSELVREYGMGEQWQMAQLDISESVNGIKVIITGEVSFGK